MIQYDGGDVHIPRKLLFEILGSDLTPIERNIFFCLLADSLGWQRANTGDAPSSKIAKITKHDSSDVRKALRTIERKGWIVQHKPAAGVHGAQYLIPKLIELGFSVVESRGKSPQVVVASRGKFPPTPGEIPPSSRGKFPHLAGGNSPPLKNKRIKECSKEEDPGSKNPSENREPEQQNLNPFSYPTALSAAHQRKLDFQRQVDAQVRKMGAYG